nr:arylesterase [Oceanococcus sp. HetDA_MAG_MS8]
MIHAPLRMGILLVVCGYLLSCGRSTPPPDLSASRTILAFGDSLTFGYGAKQSQSYPSVLAELTGKRVINAGVNGETTSAGVRRISELLEEHRPDVVLLLEGGNDLLRRQSVASIKTNLLRMIELSQSHGAQVVLIAVPKPAIFGLSDHEVYAEVATQAQVFLLADVVSEVLSDADLRSDKIHPNAAGYRQMAEALAVFFL